MMQLLDQVAGVLEQDGYAIYRRGELRNSLEFEDANLFGVAEVFDAIDDLLRSWKDTQSSFIDRHQSKFPTAKDKSWNGYVVLLTTDTPEDGGEALAEIEEDFYAVRKIVASSLDSRGSVKEALSPLLRLSSASVLASAPTDQRLRELETLPVRVRGLLAEGAGPKKLAAHFLENS